MLPDGRNDRKSCERAGLAKVDISADDGYNLRRSNPHPTVESDSTCRGPWSDQS